MPPQVDAPPPELHAPQLFDADAPPADELRRLNRALLAAFTELLGYAKERVVAR